MRRRHAVLLSLALAACSSRTANQPPPAAPRPSGGGSALMVVGTIPLVGTDVVISDALKARGLDVISVQESKATPGDAEGRRLVVLSCSMQSSAFTADYSKVAAPILVFEHQLLGRLKMTAPDGHGFQQPLTTITITSNDQALTAGLTGDVTVYARTGEMFWGIPGPGAIRVATAKGAATPERSVYFAYPAGAMMVGASAPAKRVHFFFAVHAPPPVTTLYLNDAGLKLLNAALDWSLH